MNYTPQLVDAEKLRIGTYINAGDASYKVYEGHVILVTVAGGEVIVDILDKLGKHDTYRCQTGNSIWTTGFAEDFPHSRVDISNW